MSAQPSDDELRTRPPDGRSDETAPGIGLWIVRYGIGIAMVIAGIVLLVVSPFGVDGFAMAVGGGLSVLLINMLFRLGASGDRERDQEEDARRYFDEHGIWPDEEPKQGGRTWKLAPGTVTFEDEERERREREAAARETTATREATGERDPDRARASNRHGS